MGNEDFECVIVIGKGSYGEVWLAKHKKDKKQYVLKKMNLCKASKKERKSAEQEAKLLSKLRHPNIVSYKDSFESDGFLYIAMQYCEGGDLYARLKEQKGILLDERQVVEWFVQIAMALQYMHERNILHRDLKTQNIFLTKSKIIKVGDLGIARMLDSASAMATTLIGTPYYMSPELFSNKPYNHKSDVWALGCCVYEMTTLKHAFNAKDMNSLVYKILKGKMPPMPCQYSSELLILMRNMLHQDPEKRPSVNRILRDPYIKKNIAIFLEDTKRNQQSSQSSNKQIAISVSRPSSASTCQKISASSLTGVGRTNLTTNISNSDLQKPQVSENSTDKSSSMRKPSVSLPDLESVSENTIGHDKLLSGGDTQETILPPAVKEVHSPKKENVHRKKNFLRNHVKTSKAEHNEMKVRDTELHERGPNFEEPLLIQVNKSGHIAPEFEEDFFFSHQACVKHNISELQQNEIGTKSRESGPDIKKPMFDQTEDNDETTSQHHKKENSLHKNSSHTKSSTSEQNKIEKMNERENGFEKPPRGQVKNDNIYALAKNQVLKTENKIRPLPVPRAKASAGFPEYREGKLISDNFSRSSSVSSSTEERETPRSLPNLSARQRRRQQKSEFSVCIENPNPDMIKLKRVVERKELNQITKSERNDLDPLRLRPTRQSSINDSTSSSDESQKVTEKGDSKEREIKRENKEMNNFISLLDTTLKLNNMAESSEENEEELVPSIKESINCKALLLPIPLPHQATKDQQFHKSVSMPSVETLTDTSRLMHRIRMLHTDCIKGVGYTALKEAYAVLNKIDEDEVEPKLVDLLGKEKFDEYAGKIWQLKFCEESLFEIA